jgi:ABC-type molybdate transport system permease subunit
VTVIRRGDHDSLAAPALIAGVVMTWARALREFGATILFSGNVGGRT